MSYSVTALVRQARLPKTIRCRPTAKLCLLALADRADDNGRGAWPSLATIAAESDVDDVRTIAARLKALADHQLIYQIEPPRQRKPRKWGLNLEAIEALAHRLPLIEASPDPQPVAPLNEPPPPPEVQIELPGVQFSSLDPQVHAPDPVLLDPVHLIPRASDATSGGDVPAARAVIRQILATTPGQPAWADMLELAERACLDAGVDIGQPTDHVLARAYVLEHTRAKLFPRSAERRIVNS